MDTTHKVFAILHTLVHVFIATQIIDNNNLYLFGAAFAAFHMIRGWNKYSLIVDAHLCYIMLQMWYHVSGFISKFIMVMFGATYSRWICSIDFVEIFVDMILETDKTISDPSRISYAGKMIRADAAFKCEHEYYQHLSNNIHTSLVIIGVIMMTLRFRGAILQSVTGVFRDN